VRKRIYLRCLYRSAVLPLSLLLLLTLSINAQNDIPEVRVEWSKVTATSKAIVSIQDCPEPPLLRSSPIHDEIYSALRGLNADYARLQPWFPYPKLGVAELDPPTIAKTSWDFTLLDEITEDFMAATAGHPVVADYSTLPAWMFRGQKTVPYPSDPTTIDWAYQQNTGLRDASMQEAADYQARLLGWYTKGGFIDENGKWHGSKHHYQFAYWEVLNEIDGEPGLSKEEYTRIYDATVEKLHGMSPDLKFIGLALQDPVNRPQYITYFLDPRNHRSGISIDMISYHFYAIGGEHDSPETAARSYFDQADRFLIAARYIESIRRELSPQIKTYVDELGTILSNPAAPQLAQPIPGWYWNLSAAMWAYTYAHLAELGVDIVGAAELIDYPGQFAATTLVDWQTGKPNARYRVVKLLHDNVDAGDRLVFTESPSSDIYAQGFVTTSGRRKLLLVNKSSATVAARVPGAAGADISQIDQEERDGGPPTNIKAGDVVTLPAFAVAVISLIGP
jgi:hypothetical protein